MTTTHQMKNDEPTFRLHLRNLLIHSRRGRVIWLVALGLFFVPSLKAQLDLNKLVDQAKEVAIQVQNSSPGVIFIVVDNTGRGDNVVKVARMDGTGDLSGIRIEPGQEGTVKHGANVGDAPTVHVWEIQNSRATHELLPNPPNWWTANYDGGVKIRTPLKLKWDGHILSEN